MSLDTFFGLRFITDGTAYDPKATQDADGKYRIHVVEDSLVSPPAITPLALLSGASGAIYNQIQTADARIWGCDIYGTTDCKITLTVNGVNVGFEVMSTQNRMGRIRLPAPVAVETGQNVTINIENTGPDSSTYEGVLYIG